jgi:hypothetical protein
MVKEHSAKTTVISLHPIRMRLVYLSTCSMLLTMVLLPLLYVFNPPLDFDDFVRIIQQLLPIFVGFLLSAIAYAFGTKPGGVIEVERGRLINFILIASFVFYWTSILALIALLLWSNSKYAPLNAGMSKDIFFTTLTILVSVVTGVAGGISSKIFYEAYKPASLVRKHKDAAKS